LTPRQGGSELTISCHIVERRIDVRVNDDERLARLLADSDGVESVQSGAGGVRVRYDAFRWDYESLTQLFEEIGRPVRRGWRHAIRVALFSFMDRNARAHAASPGGACCSRPAGIYGTEDRTVDTERGH
jgi:hypothetical protein